MYRFTLSLRYLLSRRLNVICVIGVALGVALLILVLSVMDGFQTQLKTTLRGSLSDVIVTPRYLVDYETLERYVREVDAEVVALSPQLQDFAIISPVGQARAPEGTAERKDGAFVIGVDAAKESAVSEFRRYLTNRQTGTPTVADLDRPFDADDEAVREDYPGVVLGRDLAWYLGVRKGSLVYLMTAVEILNQETREVELKPREMQFVVTGYYESGNIEYDRHVAYVDRQAARSLTGGRSDLKEIRIKLRDHLRAEAVKSRLMEMEWEIFLATAANREMVRVEEAALEESRRRAKVAGRDPGRGFVPGAYLWVETWRDRRKVFLAAIENEKGIMRIIVGFILLVAAFMIVAMLSMLVVHKTRDIGIIKALGGTTRGVLSIFMWNGLIMGIVGAALGLGLGLLCTWKVNQIERGVSGALSWVFGREVGLFPQQIYLFSEIPTSTDPFEVGGILVFAVLCAWLAALYPAARAARMDPVEALRYE